MITAAKRGIYRAKNREIFLCLAIVRIIVDGPKAKQTFCTREHSRESIVDSIERCERNVQ